MQNQPHHTFREAKTCRRSARQRRTAAYRAHALPGAVSNEHRAVGFAALPTRTALMRYPVTPVFHHTFREAETCRRSARQRRTAAQLAVPRGRCSQTPPLNLQTPFPVTAYIIPQILRFVKYFSQNSVNIFRFSLCDRLNSKLVSPLTAVHCTVRTHRQLPLFT